LLALPGDFEDFGKTTVQRSVPEHRRNIHLFRFMRRDPIVAWPRNDRRPEESRPSFHPVVTRLVAAFRSIFGGFHAMPETNRKRSPRKLAAMSMCCTSCVETRSFPHAASIDRRRPRRSRFVGVLPVSAHGGRIESCVHYIY
jgi:hypothetical protein